MKLNRKTVFAIAAAVFGTAAIGWTSAVLAQAQNLQTPKGWNYEIRDGRRVPKADRRTNADGSWREEMRQGNCITIKERSATGEYKETRQCNPGSPS